LENLVGHAPQQDPRQAGKPTRPHDDAACAHLSGHVIDLGRIHAGDKGIFNLLGAETQLLRQHL